MNTINPIQQNPLPVAGKPLPPANNKPAVNIQDGFKKSEEAPEADTSRWQKLKNFVKNTGDVSAGGLFGGTAIMVAGISAAQAVGGPHMIPLMLCTIAAGTAVMLWGK